MSKYMIPSLSDSFKAKRTLLVLGGCAVSLYLINKYLDKYLAGYFLRLKRQKGLDVLGINKLLTFGVSSRPCNGHKFKEFDCGNLDCNYGRLCYMLSFIENARVSVDICIYIITAKVFGDAIINAHRRGLRVRVIADSDMSFSAQSVINDLRLNEIPTRQRMSPYIMHHKFVLIDGHILLNGSMNFTMTGAFCNWENVMITTQPEMVKAFALAFQGLWEDFAPGNKTNTQEQQQHRKKTNIQNM
ncbi:mitochondrial cardiolipin hydrolase-like isoform X1 [Cimex lectularius]|uniref:Mitochondrial cardiolipin hydrolase n=1 Tax=Cimex lectularius TaxID=79782 RepID=A0A8I6TC52_CIMLE|nr:mitochondrial cardiolipin hydrolase-like isoform X1 [Cimex lectularius]